MLKEAMQNPVGCEKLRFKYNQGSDLGFGKTLWNLIRDAYLPISLIILVFGIGIALMQYFPLPSGGCYTNTLNISISGSCSLVASKTNLLGSITGILVMLNPNMVYNELSGFVAATMFLVIGGLMLGSKQRREISKLFVSLSVVGSIIATELWIFLPHLVVYSYGPSGLSYAEFGFVFSFCLFNMAFSLKGFRKLNGSITLALNGAIFAALLLTLIFSPKILFNISPNVNYPLHELSFLFTFIGSAVYFYYCKSQKLDLVGGKPKP